MEYKYKNIIFNLSEDNTHIQDSYTITSGKEIKNCIKLVSSQFSQYPELAINKRTVKDQVEEWKTHNILYKLHIFRSRTKDVDLDIYETKLRKFGYKILSWFYIWK